MSITGVQVITKGKIGGWEPCDLEGLHQRVSTWAANVVSIGKPVQPILWRRFSGNGDLFQDEMSPLEATIHLFYERLSSEERRAFLAEVSRDEQTP